MSTGNLAIDEKSQVPREIKPIDIFSFFKLLLAEDERFKIISLLANREGANMREIGRCTGVSYRKVVRSLNYLVKAGLIDVYFVGIGMRVYKLSSKCEILRSLSTSSPQ